MSDFLIPLGGGNEIGGSAYYLSLEGMISKTYRNFLESDEPEPMNW